jgi:hypothetical protein
MFALQAQTDSKGLKDASGSLMSRAEECLLRWVRVLLRVPCLFFRAEESLLCWVTAVLFSHSFIEFETFLELCAHLK